MFDSAPTNLPIEPTLKAPAPLTPPPASPVNQTGIKEPEDIFADIEPEPQSPSVSGGVMAPTPPVRGFPWRIILGIGIPVVILGLGLGGWYVYSSYMSANKTVQLPTVKENAGNIPVTEVPDNTPTIPNPIAAPDEDKLAASQAAMTLMQLQAEKGYTGETATSSSGATSTSASTGTSSNVQAQPPAAPPNIPPPTSEQESAGVTAAPLALGLDSDNDGLTNSEEALLGSDPNKSDTNANGYLDLSEIMNGYDPVLAGNKLTNSKNLKTELIGSLDVLIPVSWERKPGAGGTVQILTGTPAVVTVEIQPYATSQTLLASVVEQNQGTAERDYTVDRTKSGIDVVYSNDGMSAWLLVGNSVYHFRYNTHGASTKDFESIFKYLMIKQAHLSQS
ncbi:MAG: hypothetical protein WC750_00490 [Patescibacteria group bacterium]|jgi:hypothetical protein